MHGIGVPRWSGHQRLLGSVGLAVAMLVGLPGPVPAAERMYGAAPGAVERAVASVLDTPTFVLDVRGAPFTNYLVTVPGGRLESGIGGLSRVMLPRRTIRVARDIVPMSEGATLLRVLVTPAQGASHSEAWDVRQLQATIEQEILDLVSHRLQ